MTTKIIGPGTLSVAIASLAEAFPDETIQISAWILEETPTRVKETRYCVKVSGVDWAGQSTRRTIEEGVYAFAVLAAAQDQLTDKQRAICRDIADALEAP